MTPNELKKIANTFMAFADTLNAIVDKAKKSHMNVLDVRLPDSSDDPSSVGSNLREVVRNYDNMKDTLFC